MYNRHGFWSGKLNIFLHNFMLLFFTSIKLWSKVQPKIFVSFLHVHVLACCIVNWTSWGPTYVFWLDRLYQQPFSTLELYLKFSLNRILVYSGFSLDMFHCIYKFFLSGTFCHGRDYTMAMIYRYIFSQYLCEFDSNPRRGASDKSFTL